VKTEQQGRHLSFLDSGATQEEEEEGVKTNGVRIQYLLKVDEFNDNT
jgi:hypothetical protein